MAQRLVLIADGSPQTQQLLQAALGSCDVRVVSDATQAFTIATAAAPDLIVANVAQPGSDGFKMVQRLKSDASTAYIPVLAVTEQPYPQLQQDARTAGFDALLILPVTAATFGDVGRLLMTRAMLLRERSIQLLERSAALRARSVQVQRDTAADRSVPESTPAVKPPTADTLRCRRCGSDADNRLVRTTPSSATYRCGMCKSQWRWTFKKSADATK